MNTKIIYCFNVYLKDPSNVWNTCYPGTSSSAIEWDTMITLFGSNADDALKSMPEEYEGWAINKIDYPLGYPHFPLFPFSTTPSGAVGVDSNGNHYLRKA
ncbi:MAG: hypothetical protein AABY15_05470 [Nanoarchaeota archaeon]